MEGRIMYKGFAGDFRYFADAVEDKYYGWRLVDMIKDVEDKE